MTAHIAVIGAGIVGAAIAFRLAEGGARVTVIEAQGPAARASGASFGWINASFFANAAHFRLRQAAIAAHHRLEADLDRSLVDWSGCLWWEETGAGFDARARALAGFGYPYAEVGRAEFARLEPAVGTASERSLIFADEGATDAGAMTRALLDAAARHGARLWTGCAVQRLRVQAGRVTGVETAQGTLPADRVVVAAGTGAQALAADIEIALPMLSRPGLILRTRPVARVLRHILVSPGLEFRQDAAGHILAPTAASHQGDTSESVTQLPGDLADRALAVLRGLLPGVDLAWDRVMLAQRPVPRDGLPAVGPAAVPGLYLAVMHSGVTLAPLIGELAAQEMLRGEDAPLLESFRPDRFG